MGDKSRKSITVLLGVLLLSGFMVCGVYHYILFKSTREQCTADQCYNGGEMILETKTCTCADGYGGQCCEFKTQMCLIGQQWSEWTHCSKKCGPGGNQFRIKNNVCLDCSQTIYEKRACNVYCYNGGIPSNVSDVCICESGYGGECCECKIQNCELTPWSEWSTCTHECGPKGMRFRTRNVAKQPACGGDPCPGILTEEDECNRKCDNGTLDYEGNKCTCAVGYSGQCCACKVQNCVMTPWSDWSACSQECGPRGTAFRTRGVQTAPKCGGKQCSNIFAEQKQCNRVCDNVGILDYDAGECKCPDGFSGQCCDCKNVDCELNNWTEWSTCENATARQVRSRDVKRYPNCAGHECEGSLAEDRSCAVALKHKLLLPEWSVIVLSTYGALLTLFIITMVIYVIRRRKMIASQFENNNKNHVMDAVKDVQQDAIFTDLPPLPEKHDH